MNLRPKFLTFEQVVSLHALQIEEFGGLLGIRDEGLLRSAIAQPEAGFGAEYFHKNLQDMAAAYLFHLVKNHAFIDGNKRIAALAAAVFLEVNGLIITATEEAFEAIVMAAAEGRASQAQIADFFSSNTTDEPK